MRGLKVYTAAAVAASLAAASAATLDQRAAGLPQGAGFPLAAEGTLKPRADGIPNFAAVDYGWYEVGDDFLPPDSGPGPIFADPKHPYRSNQSGDPTYRVADTSNPILQPWVRQSLEKANARVLAGGIPYNPRERCWPAGVPAFTVYTRVRPVYIVQGAKDVLLINEGDAQTRHVYLNVPLSMNPKPSWYGESVGHYEGHDTLVVDTIAISDKTFVDNYLTPHTKALHVVERYTLVPDGRTMEVKVDVEDPGAFTTKWSARQTYRLRLQGEVDESPCAENHTNFFSLGVAPIPEAKTADF